MVRRGVAVEDTRAPQAESGARGQRALGVSVQAQRHWVSPGDAGGTADVMWRKPECIGSGCNVSKDNMNAPVLSPYKVFELRI